MKLCRRLEYRAVNRQKFGIFFCIEMFRVSEKLYRFTFLIERTEIAEFVALTAEGHLRLIGVLFVVVAAERCLGFIGVVIVVVVTERHLLVIGVASKNVFVKISVVLLSHKTIFYLIKVEI